MLTNIKLTKQIQLIFIRLYHKKIIHSNVFIVAQFNHWNYKNK